MRTDIDNGVVEAADGTAEPQATSGSSTPPGYWPADLQAAYNVPSGTAGSGKTVAIVDAYDDPNAEQDLQTYRSQFGLPAMNSGSGPKFQKVNQRGVDISTTGAAGTPSPDSGWAQEISLDLDMVSAVCPNCNILLVETDSSSFTNLAAAVDTAANYDTDPGSPDVQHVAAVSNSYGGSEFSGETKAQSHYNHPGIAITVSSGDSGYGAEFPAASQYVTAVGGTSLNRDSSTRGWSEKVWSGAGSGCSAYVSKPSWQTDKGCGRRTVADIAAVADPNTGVAVYDSYKSNSQSGWLVFGGTSAAAPIVASVYALSGSGSSSNYGSASYSQASSLYDVTLGSNGNCANRKHRALRYLCTGVTGYDGPTGNGSPNGTNAF